MTPQADPPVPVLTTSIGSLPRPEPLLALLAARESGEPVDERQFAETERAAVFEAVERQEKLGIDVPPSGEMGRPPELLLDQRIARWLEHMTPPTPAPITEGRQGNHDFH
jgi:hypothetical protein